MMWRQYPGRSHVRVLLLAAAVAAASAALAGDGSLVSATPVLLADPGRSRRRTVVLVGWIVGGAVAGGAIGLGVARATAPAAETLAVVFGTATGGGVAAVVRLFVFGTAEPAQPESVTVGGEPESVPDPEPVDLFEGSPDPILYFDDAGDGPVVRAANPAFAATFGVDASTVENAALADALMLAARTDDVVAAARSGEPFDDIVACETGSGAVEFRVRTTTVDSPVGTRGYVLYTPVGTDR